MINPNYIHVGKCAFCQTEPITLVAIDLCNRCYRESLRNNSDHNHPQAPKPEIKSAATVTKHENAGEVSFVKNFFKHTKWSHHPATFKTTEGKYTPDFYDGERDVFIEVSATQQAFNKNKHKYAAFADAFPAINFEVRTPTGALLEFSEKGHAIWSDLY